MTRFHIALQSVTGTTIYAITGAEGAWMFSNEPAHATSFQCYHHAATRILDYAGRAHFTMWVEPTGDDNGQ